MPWHSDRLKVHRSPVNKRMHDQRSIGERWSDRVAAAYGSWPFIIVQTVVFATWVLLNSLTFLSVIRWDAKPFILFNLVMSAEAAYATPIILMAQNRSSEHDRLKAESDFTVDSEALELLRALKSQIESITPKGDG